MKDLLNYLEKSYTAYQAVENAEALLKAHGFEELLEENAWHLKSGGKYFVRRGGSALIAFAVGNLQTSHAESLSFKIVASHTDSPCFKLKEQPAIAAEPFTKLNVEPYGGGIYYSFFDRPLKIAGRVVREQNGALVAENYVSDFCVTIPSLAIHMARDVNEKFAPNPQIDLLPLLGFGKAEFEAKLGNAISYDLYAVPAEAPFYSGLNNEFVSSPRVDNLTSVYGSLCALAQTENNSGVCVAACFNSEEIGSRTLSGAASDFLAQVLKRVVSFYGLSQEEFFRALRSSFVISLDNAHSIHPNRPEKCDLTNRAALGGGVVIKNHANGAYVTDALSSAIIKSLFQKCGVKHQSFYNRSDMRSGGTLGVISLGQVSVLSADLGLCQLAMHSAVETFMASDYLELEKALTAFYACTLQINDNQAKIL